MPYIMHLKANQFKNADNNIFKNMPYTMHLKANQFKNNQRSFCLMYMAFSDKCV